MTHDADTLDLPHAQTHLPSSSPQHQHCPPQGTKLFQVGSQIDLDMQEYCQDIRTIAHNIKVLSSRIPQARDKEAEDKIAQEAKAIAASAQTYAVKVKECIRDLEELIDKRGELWDGTGFLGTGTGFRPVSDQYVIL